MKIVHLPCYDINPYQRYLMDAQSKFGHETLPGGGGGDFLKTALFKWKADVMHFHWLHPYLLRESKFGSIWRSVRFILEILILKLAGIRIVWTIHNLQNHDKKHVGIERFFSKIFARLCSTRLAHTHEAAKQAGAYFSLKESSIDVISHPSYVGLYPSVVSQMDARARFSVSKEARILLFLGRIHEYKGVFDLIECFKDTDENDILIIAGEVDGEETKTRLENAVKENDRIIVHPKRVPDEELQYYFTAADSVVFPYRDILTSGAVVLAMSFAKHVVVPDKPGLRETVSEEGGTFFEAGNLTSLANAIQSIKSTNLSKAGTSNLERAKDWSLERIAEKTVVSYRLNK